MNIIKRKKWGKKGVGPAVIIWGLAALATGLWGLISQLGPEPTGIAAIPIWGWLVGGLVLLMLIKK